MSATSLIFFSLLTLLTTVPSTANSDILNVVRYFESIKNFHATITTMAYQIPEIPTEVIHPYVSDLPGLLLLVVRADHSALDHQLSCT